MTQLPTMQPSADYRDIGDIAATRQAIFDNVRTAANSYAPISNQRYSLQLADVDYDGPDTFTAQDEKRAIIRGETLGRRLRGTWQLKSPDGAVVDQRKLTLGTVPYLSSHGTFIFNGSSYGFAHQNRLRPGIFTRRKESGEYESHVNVARGVGHRYFLDPTTGVFRIEFGQSQMPLMPILRVLGATDSQLRKAWGNEIYAANVKAHDSGAVRKMVQKLQRSKQLPADDASAHAVIRKAFADMLLDPEVTKRTLGKPYTNVDAETILDTTGKLLRISRGEDDVDDRDAMAFQRLMGPEDVFAERLQKTRAEATKLLWKATFAGNLQKAQPNTFDRALRGTLLQTGLGNLLEEINPAELLDQMHRTTRLGEGGIGSMDAVPAESRNVQPSQLGFIDPVHSPESGSIGIDTRLAINTRKGKDGKIYSKFLNARTGKADWVDPQTLADVPVAFPGELESNEPYVRVIDKGKIRFVPRDKVAYQLSTMTDAFGPLANLVPMKYAAFPQRVSMGCRMTTQAVPLVDREAPYVQSAIGDTGQSFEELYGEQMGAVRGRVGGTVVDIQPDNMRIKDATGKEHTVDLLNNTPFNRKTYWHNTPTVQVGQQVQPGDLLATSNYTNGSGTTAMGRNARVAYIPYKGINYEDAVVISEAFAKKLTSEHLYQHDLDKQEHTKISKNAYLSIYPGKLSKQMLGNFDDNGIIKPGTTVNYGDPLILAVRQRQTGPRLGRRQRSFVDASVTWEHHAPGTVTDAYDGKRGINVMVKSTNPMQVGDKLAGRYGDKGVVAAIVPDEDMPTDESKQPFDLLVSPLGVISRGNPAQIMEAALGKIAAKTGQPVKVPDFKSPGKLRDWVEQQLALHNIKDTEKLYDPKESRYIPDVMTGNRFIMKLHHMSESKLQGRATGSYSAEETPTKGGEGGSSKRVGMLGLNALLSHGAYDVVHDINVVRGQRNDEYWRQVMSGYSPPIPRVPLVYKKFIAELQASGINPIRRGSKINVMALRDRDIDQLAEDRELRNAETVSWKTGQLHPLPGGLFDPQLTGGHGGSRWSYYKLHRPVPNPVMEEPIRRLLGLTEQKYRDVLAGREKLGDYQGPDAIAKALDNINVDRELERARTEIKGSRKTARDVAVRRLGYLKSAKQLNIHPREWLLSKVPVLPPIFRPVSMLSDSKVPVVADPNYLYKELFDANQNLRNLESKVDDVGDERLTVYDSLKAVVGLGDPVQPALKQQKVRGILQHVMGSSPKFGVVQRRLLGSSVDLVGRSVIVPNPDLDMDHVGIPEDKAWTVYKPFIVRRLVRNGMPNVRALEAVEKREAVAKQELLREMNVRPVIIDRAPVLHRYGTMAFWPKLTQNKAMELPPLITSGFGADFDGDTMNFHVPASERAVEQAIEKMLPSKNLISPQLFKTHYHPTMDYVSGLWAASNKQDDKKPVRRYVTKADAIRAYRRGEIGVGQRVVIMEN